jgi:hypothetical protein
MAKATRKPLPADAKTIMLKIDAQAWATLRKAAIDKGTTLNAIGLEGINLWLKKNALPGTARNPLLD